MMDGSLPEIIIEGSCKTPLPNLKVLYLRYNQLMEKLPKWLGELRNLRGLDLSYNYYLEGPIPSSLGTL